MVGWYRDTCRIVVEPILGPPSLSQLRHFRVNGRSHDPSSDSGNNPEKGGDLFAGDVVIEDCRSHSFGGFSYYPDVLTCSNVLDVRCLFLRTLFSGQTGEAMKQCVSLPASTSRSNPHLWTIPIWEVSYYTGLVMSGVPLFTTPP